MGSSFLSEVDDTSILRTGALHRYHYPLTWLSASRLLLPRSGSNTRRSIHQPSVAALHAPAEMPTALSSILRYQTLHVASCPRRAYHRERPALNPHSARCLAGAQLPATSCLGAFRPPATSSCGGSRDLCVRKPAHEQTST